MSESRIKDNLDAVRQKIACAAKSSGRSIEDVTLVGITKHCSAEAARQAWGHGQRAFGENYVQEAMKKQEVLADLPIEWHFTGRIQTNKAKYLAGRFTYIHTVDSAAVAEAVHRRLDGGSLQQVLIQVNIGDEPQKSGVSEQSLLKLAELVASLPRLRLYGLMCLPPFRSEGEETRPYFAKLRELRDKLAKSLGLDLPTLSMGMSSDYVQAIEEGATHVRVGSGIFGQRSHN